MAGIIGHQAIIRELTALASSADPPHALLFAGPDGSGRRLLALHYVKLLNCERRQPPAGASLFGNEQTATTSAEPCGTCRACRLIDEGTHPDVITVRPGDSLCRPRPGEASHPAHADSRDIRVCQARGIIDAVSRYPFEASVRAVIIDPAERITPGAANTLLKTLEEPPGHTVFALITAAPESLIETILSRCRRIDVRQVARTEIEAGLVERGIEQVVAQAAALEARGKPGQALTFAAHPDRMEDRGRLLERCGKIAAARAKERFDYAESIAERYRRDRGSVLNELDAWETFWERRLRESAAVRDEAESRAVLRALEGVVTARTDLQTQVMTRGAIELMLLSFPRVTLNREEPVVRQHDWDSETSADPIDE